MLFLGCVPFDSYSSISSPQDPRCGVPSDSCMDDHQLAASGFAWIAAFEYQKLRSDYSAFAALLVQELQYALVPRQLLLTLRLLTLQEAVLVCR